MTTTSKVPKYYHTITKMYNHSDHVVDRLVHGLLRYTKENNIPIDSQLEIKITKILDDWAQKDERTNKYFYFFVPYMINSILAAYFCYVESNTLPGLYDVVDGSSSPASLYYENPKYKSENVEEKKELVEELNPGAIMHMSGSQSFNARKLF